PRRSTLFPYTPLFRSAVLGVLHGGRFGHDAHGALRGVVGHVDAVLADEAGDRGDVDDRAPAGLLHGRDRVLHTQEDALGVDVHHLVPHGHAHGVGAGAADPGVVHQDVELAEGRDGGLHRRLPVGLVGDVDLHEARLTAGLGDVVDDIAPLRLQHVADGDPGPLLREDHRLAPTHA